MDFFQQQDEARQSTTRLVVLFAGAVLAIIGAVYALCVVLLGYAGAQQSGAVGSFWYPEVFAGVAIATLGIIGLGALYKTAQLRGGGATVAESLGGRLVLPNTTEPLERRLLNVVEEMSIASGTPVPPVYVMEHETGINAFAAGFSPESAVVGVTRGCLERLTRDELQGVIAHEFSHILNGDMRLNIHLMGVLHGILVIALVGYYTMRAVGRGAGRSSRKEGGGIVLALFLFGAGLAAIGFIGVFFAKLIKSGVSRQREFLADSSAVQFTRNPSGIADALKRIGGVSAGSGIEHPAAEEASHFFFANGLSSFWGRAMATHPPLLERITRIEPSFVPEQFAEFANAAGLAEVASGVSAFAGPDVPKTGTANAKRSLSMQSEEVLRGVGTPTPEHVAYASNILADLPAALRDATHEPSGAMSLVYALLLHAREDIRAAQFATLRSTVPDWQVQETVQYGELMRDLPPEYRLPVFDLTIPALKQLSERQYMAFRQVLVQLTEADAKTDLFEYMLSFALKRHLDAQFMPRPVSRIAYYSVKPLRAECAVLFATLARIGHGDADAAATAYHGACRAFAVEDMPGFDAVDTSTKRAFSSAIRKLSEATPGIKKRVLRGCVESVLHDGEVTVSEAELLRAIADALHCPIPPFLKSTTS